MKIKRIVLKHFGKFHDKEISFEDGVNLIYGDNESGKSTIHFFIEGILFGIEKGRGRSQKEDPYERYLPWDTPTLYSGIMDIELNSKNLRIYRTFYKGDKSFRLLDLDTGNEINTDKLNLVELYDGLTKDLFRNTISIAQSKSATEKELVDELKNYIANLTNSGDINIDMVQAMGLLKDQLKDITKGKTKEKLLQLAEKVKVSASKEKEYDNLVKQKQEIERRIGQANKELELIKKDKQRPLVVEHEKPNNSARILGAICGGISIISLFLVSGVIKYVLSIIFLFVGGICWFKKGVKKEVLDIWEEDHSLKIKLLQEQIIQLEENNKSITRILDIMEQDIDDYYRYLQEETELKERLCREEVEIKALTLAIHTMESSATSMKNSLGGCLNNELSKIVEEVTGGRYKIVKVDEEYQIRVQSEDDVVLLNQLSKGTIEQIYFGFRLCVAKLLFKNKDFPILLDECFHYYDEKRLLNTLKYLSHLTNRQIFIFTCHHREKEQLGLNDLQYNYISL